jgi:DNA-binding NarL/FixJ family response regulator
VSDPQASPPRVLLGNLAPIVRVGMQRVLAEDCAEVLDGERDDGGSVVADAGRLRPDVVVLSRDGTRGDDLCARVRAAAPGAKVILWAPEEDEMEVLDPGHDAPRRVAPPLPKALLGELGCVERTMERE